jgi:hypothetical protein
MRGRLPASVSAIYVAFEPKVFNDFSRIKRKPGYGTNDFDVRQGVIKAVAREFSTKSA